MTLQDQGFRAGRTRRQVLKRASKALSGAAAFALAPAVLRAQAPRSGSGW